MPTFGQVTPNIYWQSKLVNTSLNGSKTIPVIHLSWLHVKAITV